MDAPTGEEPSEVSKSRLFKHTSFVITDAATAGGMSGGPLVEGEGCACWGSTLSLGRICARWEITR